MLLFFIMLPFGKELQELYDIIKQDSTSILRGEQGHQLQPRMPLVISGQHFISSSCWKADTVPYILSNRDMREPYIQK